MGILSWLRQKKETEPKQKSQKLEDFSIPIFRTEDDKRILETRIKPVKIPTIVDIGEKLGLILKQLEEIKTEMVSKSWLNTQYDDTSVMSQKIDMILKKIQPVNFEITDEILHKEKNDADEIIRLLSQQDKLTYSKIKEKTGLSDPVLSHRLKKLVNKNKLNRQRKGRSVFYSV